MKLDACITIEEALGAKLIKTCDSLTPLTKDLVQFSEKEREEKTEEKQEELYVHDVNLNTEGKVKSEIIDIEKTKDNVISKTKLKNILEKEEYEEIKNEAFNKIKEISKNILRR